MTSNRCWLGNTQRGAPIGENVLNSDKTFVTHCKCLTRKRFNDPLKKGQDPRVLHNPPSRAKNLLATSWLLPLPPPPPPLPSEIKSSGFSYNCPYLDQRFTQMISLHYDTIWLSLLLASIRVFCRWDLMSRKVAERMMKRRGGVYWLNATAEGVLTKTFFLLLTIRTA